METKKVRIVIDDALIASTTDVLVLVEPIWAIVDMHRSWGRYMSTLRRFSINQRHLFAIQWYRAEVNNGGHDQFFWNGTGIVSEHALDGFGALGLVDAQAVLKTASDRLGGAARDRTERQSQLELTGANFDDLDERFYDIERTGALDEKLLAFAREHAADFRFNAFVEMLDLPRRGSPSRLN
jgi:hypothetical protein